MELDALSNNGFRVIFMIDHNNLSEYKQITRGVPRGSMGNTIVSNDYINDLPNISNAIILNRIIETTRYR